MLGEIIITSCLVIMTFCWRIDVSEKNIAIQLSPNVTLECRNDADNCKNYPKLAHINRLRILKRNPSNQWDPLVKVMQHPPHFETSLHDAVVTGKANNISDSFIKLQFSLATHEMIGQFVCEVDGYDERDELEHLKTKPVVIIERGVTYGDLLKVILKFKKHNRTEHVDDQLVLGLLQKSINLLEIKENSTSTLLMKLTDRINEIDNDHLRLTKSLITKQEPSNEINNITNKIQRLNNDFLRLADKQKHIKNNIKLISKENPSIVWPTGNYSLLQTKDGCPYSLKFDWQFSSVKMTTKPGPQNKDLKSSNSHLPTNTLQHDNITDHHYVYMTMCSKNVTTEGPYWPKGSYCIGGYHSCPSRLKSGSIYFGRYEDGSRKDAVVNQPGIGGSNQNTRHSYCCRNDGKASRPMTLPAQDPFYLYRFGGQCQEVENMDVNNEWLILDTNKQHDRYSYRYHPDGHIKTVTIEMCYYKPRV